MNYRALIAAEQKSLEASEREWDRIRALRVMMKDAELRSLLGVTEETLFLAFALVHRSQKQTEAKHFDDMDKLAQAMDEAIRKTS